MSGISVSLICSRVWLQSDVNSGYGQTHVVIQVSCESDPGTTHERQIGGSGRALEYKCTLKYEVSSDIQHHLMQISVGYKCSTRFGLLLQSSQNPAGMSKSRFLFAVVKTQRLVVM